MAADPIFYTVPYAAQVTFNTANTARDGTGTLATIVDNSGGSTPIRIDRIRLAATGTTTAGKIRWFWDDGTNKYYYTGFDVQAITASATVEPWQLVLNFPRGLIVKAGWKLRFTTHVGEAFVALAEGATPS